MNGRKPGPDRAALALLDPDGTFLERLREDRAALLTLLEGLGDGAAEKKMLLVRLRRLAHRLAGAAGTFGHDDIGEAAMTLDDCLAEIPDFSTRSIDRVIAEANHLSVLLDGATAKG
jgi:HPt (histidine-containing phosphotransfer) domain-containing protein